METLRKSGPGGTMRRLLACAVVALSAGCAAGNRLEPQPLTHKDAIESLQIQPPGALVINVLGL